MAEPLSVYWDLDTWDRTRAAFVAQLEDVTAARHLVEWIVRTIHDHVARTPAERSQLAAGLQRDSGGVRKVHQVAEDVVMGVAAAQLDDLRTVGRHISRSAWICEAASIAANQLEQQLGNLPPAPERLPSGPRPRPRERVEGRRWSVIIGAESRVGD